MLAPSTCDYVILNHKDTCSCEYIIIIKNLKMGLLPWVTRKADRSVRDIKGDMMIEAEVGVMEFLEEKMIPGTQTTIIN